MQNSSHLFKRAAAGRKTVIFRQLNLKLRYKYYTMQNRNYTSLLKWNILKMLQTLSCLREMRIPTEFCRIFAKERQTAKERVLTPDLNPDLNAGET